MLSYLNVFKIEEIGQTFIWHVPNLHARMLRFKTLAAPARPCGVAKISKAGENLKKPNLGPRHRLSRIRKYT